MALGGGSRTGVVVVGWGILMATIKSRSVCVLGGGGGGGGGNCPPMPCPPFGSAPDPHFRS